MLTTRFRALAAALALAAAGSGAAAALAADQPTVFAAASLSKVFPKIDPSARFSFGGSNALEAQILKGAPVDVFASASPKQTAALYRKGLVEVPLEFALNRLVLIVPKTNPAHIRSVSDVTRSGVKLVICQASVPCGDYARNVFKNLGITAAAEKNVVSQTTDVSQVVTDVALGQADAGFVYVTDARSAGSRVKAIALPARAKPNTRDYIAVLKHAPHHAAAEAFVNMVFRARGKALLRAAGFTIPK